MAHLDSPVLAEQNDALGFIDADGNFDPEIVDVYLRLQIQEVHDAVDGLERAQRFDPKLLDLTITI